MDLRPELMPPALDEALVRRLARLAARLDGRSPAWQEELAEFNRLAGTALPIDDFQGIYGAEDHEDWVRRVLYHKVIKPAPGISREDLTEVVRRAMSRSESFADREAYRAVFDANVPLENASNLLFYPPDYDPATNTWGGGRAIREYDPTPEGVVAWALAPDDSASHG